MPDFPSAYHTTWWSTEDGDSYLLILHDKEDKPYAAVVYTFDNWMEVFNNLLNVARKGKPYA